MKFFAVKHFYCFICCHIFYVKCGFLNNSLTGYSSVSEMSDPVTFNEYRSVISHSILTPTIFMVLF